MFAVPRSALKWVAIALAIVSLAPSPVHAQAAATGTIVGAVRDASDAILPGVSVELRGERLMGVRTVTTDERGQYSFRSLAPGLYDLTFTLTGFASETRSGVRVLVGGSSEENVALRLEGVAESVTVRASAPVVDTKASKVQTNFDREWIDNSPNQRRSFMDIVTNAPGVEPGDIQNRVQPVSYGSNVDQNLFQLDGVDLTDHFNGNATTLVQPSIDTLEEVEVLSLGAPAEYGSHEGAVFNVVTRQGTNEFRGGAAFYYESDNLTGRNTTEEVDGGDPFTRIDYEQRHRPAGRAAGQGQNLVLRRLRAPSRRVRAADRARGGLWLHGPRSQLRQAERRGETRPPAHRSGQPGSETRGLRSFSRRERRRPRRGPDGTRSRRASPTRGY